MGAKAPPRDYLNQSCISKLLRKFQNLKELNAERELIALLKMVPWGETINETNTDEKPPLVQALDLGVASVLKALIELGANLSIKDREENTPLVYLLKKLIENNDWILKKDFDAEQAFDILISATNGDDIDTANMYGETALSLARKLNNVTFIEKLTRKGARSFYGNFNDFYI